MRQRPQIFGENAQRPRFRALKKCFLAIGDGTPEFDVRARRGAFVLAEGNTSIVSSGLEAQAHDALVRLVKFGRWQAAPCLRCWKRLHANMATRSLCISRSGSKANRRISHLFLERLGADLARNRAGTAGAGLRQGRDCLHSVRDAGGILSGGSRDYGRGRSCGRAVYGLSDGGSGAQHSWRGDRASCLWKMRRRSRALDALRCTTRRAVAGARHSDDRAKHAGALSLEALQRLDVRRWSAMLRHSTRIQKEISTPTMPPFFI